MHTNLVGKLKGRSLQRCSDGKIILKGDVTKLNVRMWA